MRQRDPFSLSYQLLLVIQNLNAFKSGIQFQEIFEIKPRKINSHIIKHRLHRVSDTGSHQTLTRRIKQCEEHIDNALVNVREHLPLNIETMSILFKAKIRSSV
jgi:ribosomal protein L23